MYNFKEELVNAFLSMGKTIGAGLARRARLATGLRVVGLVKAGLTKVLRFIGKSFVLLTFKESLRLFAYAYSSFVYGIFLFFYSEMLKISLIRILLHYQLYHGLMGFFYAKDISYIYLGIAFWGTAYRIEVMSLVLEKDPSLSKQLTLFFTRLRRSPFYVLKLIGRTGGVGGAAMSGGGGPRGALYGLCGVLGCAVISAGTKHYQQYKSDVNRQREKTIRVNHQTDKAADTERYQADKAAESERYQADKAAENERYQADKAAENERYQADKAADNEAYKIAMDSYNARWWFAKGKEPERPSQTYKNNKEEKNKAKYDKKKKTKNEK